MSVHGTGCLLSKGAVTGLASDAVRKPSGSTDRQTDSGPQVIETRVYRPVTGGLATLAMIVAILGGAEHALGQCATTKTVAPQTVVPKTLAAVEELNTWLGASDGVEQTFQDLPIEQLTAELSKGRQADWGSVAAILVAVINCDEQPEGTELAAVRRSLEEWLEELPPPETEGLVAACRAAKGAYRQNDEADLARARSELVAAVERLDARLKAAGASGDGWRAFLRWETLEKQLAGPSAPDSAVLNSLYPEYDSEHEGLGLVWFDDVRLTLLQYLYTANAIEDSKLADQYGTWLDELAKRVESYGATQSSEDASIIGRAIQRLHYAGQAGWLVSAVRRRSLRPNLYAHASVEFIQAAMSRDVDETQPVRDWILGTDIHATAHTVGAVNVELGESADRAMIHMVMSGTVQSDSVGYNGPVRVYSKATTGLNSRKTILVDAQRVWALPATSSATTDSTIRSIRSNRGKRLVERIAWKRAMRQKGQAERIASRHAEERANRQVDEESAKEVDEADESYQSRFRTPLSERKLFPDIYRTSSTATAASLNLVQAGPFDLSTASEPPELRGNPDVAVRIHESMVNNMAAGAFAGVLVEEERALSVIENLLGELPESLEPDENSDPWKITFSKQKPIEVSFSDGQFKITIRGRGFSNGQSQYRGMDIFVTYEIEQTDAGLRAVRLGDIEAFPPGFDPKSGKRLSGNQQMVREMLQQRMRKIFEELLVPKPIELPGERKDRGQLVLSEWDTAAGWLTMGWEWEDAAPDE